MKRKWMMIFLFLSGHLLHGSQDCLTKYFHYLEQYPRVLGPIGSSQEGEIEIILDPAKIQEIQEQTKRTVGLVADDKYWIWVNDAVRFPSGSYGVYSRVLWKQSLKGIPGVAILPVLPDGKIALNRNYRHATRSWEYELPRGGLLENETPEQAALREMKEETGLIADKIEFLGFMNPDSGMTNTCIPVYLAQVSKSHSSSPDDSEAIASIDSFTLSEIKQGFIDGVLKVKILEGSKEVPLRDPFLTFALFQWEIRQ